MVAINDNNPTMTCAVEIIANGAALTSAPAGINDVTYDASVTPILTAPLSPRFGNVKGGDTITFTGTNFPTTGTTTITIDTVSCGSVT